MYKVGDKQPSISSNYYIAPGASVIGDIRIGEEVSIWFNAVLRGDNDAIEIGDGSNIQDGAVLHVDDGQPITIGQRVTVGHQAVLHGCTIGDGSLIGINAVVLNGAVIGKHCLIGANALITEGMEIPDGSLVMGSPAKVVKQLDDKTLDAMEAGVQNYIDKITLYRDGLTRIR